MGYQILIVDDDPHFASLIGIHLRAQGAEVVLAESLQAGLATLRSREIDLILLDVHLPDGLGVERIRDFKALREVPIMMVSGSEDTAHVVTAIRSGASDYLRKPINPETVWGKILPLLEMSRVKTTERELNHGTIVGTSPPIRQLIREISKVAHSDASILIRGESGTGKNLVAEVIHAHSPRRNKPFVTINCPAIPENLLESELFGHEKGAFTGAIRDKAGKFELADGGTLFLDEIGDLSFEMQAKLLRAVQGREFERVGGLKTIRVDVRIIAATNRDLERAIRENQFREDLFYRLNVLPLTIPPLRERHEDIPLLIDHFLRYYSRKSNKRFAKLSPDLLRALVAYPWPGNIREMQNIIERAVILGQEPELRRSDLSLPDGIRPTLSPAPASEPAVSLKEMEYRELLRILEQSGGSITKASALLQVSRGTIYRRLKQHKVQLKRRKKAKC